MNNITDLSIADLYAAYQRAEDIAGRYIRAAIILEQAQRTNSEKNVIALKQWNTLKHEAENELDKRLLEITFE